MERYFVGVSPGNPEQNEYFIVFADSFLEAALLAASASPLRFADVDASGYVLISQECIPTAGEEPTDLRCLHASSIIAISRGLCRQVASQV
jgi:hypothetical protein